MRYSIIVSTLGLSLGFTFGATAQTIDTLRRQLQVETSEELILEERIPLSTSIQAPQAYKARQVRLSPVSLRESMPALELQPLTLIQSPQSFYYDRKQRGYISIGAGLKYNAYLSAGIRAIDQEDTSLDIIADGLYSHHTINDNQLSRTAQEQGLRLSGHFATRLRSGLKLAIDAGYKHQKYNYHGYLPLDKGTAVYDEGLMIGKPYLTHNNYTLAVSLGRQDIQEGVLSYQFRPELGYSQVSGLGVWEQTRKSNEIKLAIDGTLKYGTGEMHFFGLDLMASNYIYNKSAEDLGLGGEVFTYSSKSTVGLKPYWSYKSEARHFDWGLRLGAGVDFYQEHQNKGVQLSPYAEVYIKPSEDWLVKLEALGGIRSNSLSEMLSEMPYLRILQNAKVSRIPLDLRLKAQGLLSDQVSIEFRTQYSKYLDGVNYLLIPSAVSASAISGGGSTTPSSSLDHQVAFTPVSANGSVLKVGADIDYRFAQQFALKGGLTYNHWSKSDRASDISQLYGRPSLEANVSLTYRPSQALELILGYELKHGIKQMLSNFATSQIVSVPALSLFRFSGAYNLTKAWTLKGSAHVLSHADATLYYGYTAQRFAATLGVSYCF